MGTLLAIFLDDPPRPIVVFLALLTLCAGLALTFDISATLIATYFPSDLLGLVMIVGAVMALAGVITARYAPQQIGLAVLTITWSLIAYGIVLATGARAFTASFYVLFTLACGWTTIRLYWDHKPSGFSLWIVS